MPDAPHPAGLCGSCAFARRVASARGSRFLRCALSQTDPRFAKYPRLPVIRCAGYEETTPTTENAAP